MELDIARGKVVADKVVEGVAGHLKHDGLSHSLLMCHGYPGYEDPTPNLECLGPDILGVVTNHTPSAGIITRIRTTRFQ